MSKLYRIKTSIVGREKPPFVDWLEKESLTDARDEWITTSAEMGFPRGKTKAVVAECSEETLEPIAGGETAEWDY